MGVRLTTCPAAGHFVCGEELSASVRYVAARYGLAPSYDRVASLN